MRDRYTLTAGGAGVRIVRGPVPPCAPTEVLLRVRHSLISAGTERHYVAQLAGGDDELPLGYCAVGTVVERGDRVDGVAPGELAIAMGWTIATHSDYVVAPARLVCGVPAGVRPEHALLATLGATAVHAADRAALVDRDRVLVVGLGAVGMLVALVAADRGCEVWGWDRDPAARAARVGWRELDPPPVTGAPRGTITAAFLCVDGDLGALFDLALPLLDPEGNGARRSRVVNVGRATGAITLAPATGNVDLVNASRCGAGYRDDAYHHGLRDVAVVAGEHRVDDNLRRALDVVARNAASLDRVPFRYHTPVEALALYTGAGVPSGVHLIDHGPT
jgi:NADPH:quinone reductase